MTRLDPEQLQWLEEVYDQYRDTVFRTCLRFAGGDRAWALDRTQDTFLKVAHNAQKLAGQADVGGWVYRVAVRECLVALRRSRTRERLQRWIPRPLTPDEGPERATGAHRDLGRLKQALETLSPAQRAIVVLVHVEGKTQSEAARLLGISKGQASKLHSRATETLRHREWETPDG